MKNSSFSLEKPAFYKLGFLSFILSIMFLAGFQTNMTAQTTAVTSQGIASSSSNKQLQQVPGGNFVSSQIALERLNDALGVIKGQMQQSSPGSAQYANAYRRYVYYKAIISNINNGKGVAQSIVDAVLAIRMSTAPPVLATPEQALVERNAAISLLQ